MKKQLKKWTALGAVFAAATNAQAMGPLEAAAPSTHVLMVAEAVQDAGEAGEAGESGDEQAIDLAVDDAAFIAILGEVEGHLRAANELYKLGAVDLAKTHVKHPEDELYADLLPVFEKRKLQGFGLELSDMAKAIEGGAKADAVTAALEIAVLAIDTNSAKVKTAKSTADAIHRLARTAADEYKIGVADGAIKDAHEFQDAWGFIETAKRLVDTVPESEKAANAEAFSAISAQLASLAPAWRDLTGASGTTVAPDVLAGAAARIEIATLSVK
jgi:hypothetical protein